MPMQTMPVADTYPNVDFEKNIVLECSDGQTCVVEKDLFGKCDVLLKLMNTQEDQEVKVPLTEITSDTIRRIYLYLDHFKNEWPPASTADQGGIDRPLKSDLTTFLSPFEVEYYKNELLENGDMKKNTNIFLVLKAAQYLACAPLTTLAAAALANIVRDIKGEKDFYERFNVEEPFTQEEKDKLYDDYEYRKPQNETK